MSNLDTLATWADLHPTDDELQALYVAFHLESFTGSITSKENAS